MSDVERESMVEKAAKSNQASLDILVRGAEKTFDNAERLFREAEILAKGGAVARALCLHQISLEEGSKVNNLGAWAISLVLGFEVRATRSRKLASAVTSRKIGGAAVFKIRTVGSNFCPKLSAKRLRKRLSVGCARLRAATRRSCAEASAAMSHPIAASSGIFGRTNTGVQSVAMCYSWSYDCCGRSFATALE